MLGAVFIFLVAVGISEATYNCSVPTFVGCMPDDFVPAFPETREELAIICKSEIEFIECMEQAERECLQDPGNLDLLSEILAIIKKDCDENGPLYADREENLKCVKPIMEDMVRECVDSKPEEDVLELYSTYILGREIPAFTENQDDMIECMEFLYVFACDVLRIEKKCGTKAAEVFQKLVYVRTRKLFGQFGKCNVEVKEYFDDVVDAIRNA